MDLSRGMVVLGALASCAGERPHARVAAADTGEIVLFRDGALVVQLIPITVPAGSTHAVIRAQLPAGVAPKDLAVVGRGSLELGALRQIAPAEPGDEARESPTTIELEVSAPDHGAHAVQLAYTTPRITWEAAYTMTTTAARDRVQVRGALAVRNGTGLEFPITTLALVDAELAAWRDKLRDDLAVALVGVAASATSRPSRRALGRVALPVGETHLELLPDDPPRVMRSVLVYDPFGTTLDHDGEQPSLEPELGTRATPQVTESFEIVRDPRANAGLPAGPVRLLERRADGALNLLGQARAFEATSRVAQVDTIAVGTASEVTARRERVELTIDEHGKRAVEEFAITIDSARALPVDVVLREHLYRGPNWTLAYHSAPAILEGSQQFSMRTRVPAHGRAKTVHVVVYWWISP